LIAEAAREALHVRGSFSLALSGGSTPRRMFELLGEQPIPFERTEIFQVDERVAPDGDPDRNLSLLREHLPGRAFARVRPMPVTAHDLDAAAAAYAAALPEPLDLAHLGLGADGHTASLVPGDPVLDVRDRLVAMTAGAYGGRRRMTLTYPALGAAHRVLWLISGTDRSDALSRLLAGDPSIPAGRVQARDGLVLADSDAAQWR
jgi:6-phosphogluconolactonase